MVWYDINQRGALDNTATPRNGFQSPFLLHQKMHKTKLKVFIDTNNARDENASQSNLVSAHCGHAPEAGTWDKSRYTF